MLRVAQHDVRQINPVILSGVIRSEESLIKVV